MYVLLERFEDAEKLFLRYDCEQSANMLFPMCVMCFKQGDYKRTKKFLKDLHEANEYVIDLLLDRLENVPQLDTEFYSHGSIEEADLVIGASCYLLKSTPYFLEYLDKEYD